MDPPAAADPRPRDRSARIRRPLRRLDRGRGQGRRAESARPGPSWPGSTAMGGAVAAVESGYMKQRLVESNTRAPRRRSKPASRRWSASTASPTARPRRSRPAPMAVSWPSIPRRRRSRSTASGAWRAARDPRGRGRGAGRAAPGRRRGPEHHAALDRLRPGRASPPANGRRRCASCSASTARRPASAAPARWPPASSEWPALRARVEARRGKARPAAEDAGRQARARRPFQRRRADRRARRAIAASRWSTKASA